MIDKCTLKTWTIELLRDNHFTLSVSSKRKMKDIDSINIEYRSAPSDGADKVLTCVVEGKSSETKEVSIYGLYTTNAASVVGTVPIEVIADHLNALDCIDDASGVLFKLTIPRYTSNNVISSIHDVEVAFSLKEAVNDLADTDDYFEKICLFEKGL